MKEEKGFLKWKLQQKPTVSDVSSLVNVGILTKEEARKIILEQTNDVRQTDIEAIKDEIKLLRKLVLENSRSNPIQIVEIIRREVQEVPYRWTNPYNVYCSSMSSGISDIQTVPALSSDTGDNLTKNELVGSTITKL